MAKEESLISIIVPCFNQAGTIGETLNSVLSQTYLHWECIVVNDGSSDKSLEKIEKFARNDNRFRLIDIANAGVSNARNTAIAVARGQYIFPLDGDDLIDKDCLKKCLSEFEQNPELKLVCPAGQLFGGETGLWNLPEFDYRTMLKYNMIHNSSLFLKADFDQVGGYRTNMKHGLEDWDFFIALLYGSKPEQVVKINEPLFYYRVNQTGRRLTAAADGQAEMLDLIVYNNFAIYQEYFPDIFHRVQAYDFQKTMLEKAGVKSAVKFYMFLSRLKRSLIREKRLKLPRR